MRSNISVGTDIVEVARVSRLARQPRFLMRVFTPAEIRYCRGKRNAAQHFAVRFAAKEAVWKALSSRVRENGIGHKEIGVRRLSSGQPLVALSPRLKKFEKKIALSLSHTKDYATAVAVFLNS